MKISIVTTVYGVEQYIKQCLDSLVNQTYTNLEIIIVNDCTTDGSMDIVNMYNDSRIKIINHTTNLGAGWARRHGIEAATGDYVITVDADDWLDLDFIEKLANNAKETNADIVSGGITIAVNPEYWEIKKFLPTISTEFKKFQDYNNQKIIFLNNKLVKRSMYETVPYSTRKFCEDTPVIIPLLYYANMVSYVDTQGYYYRQHQQSLCKRVNPFEKALFKALCCKDLIKFFEDKGSEYSKLINTQEFIQYLKILKENQTDDICKQYSKELGELTPTILNLLEF